ERRLRAPLDDPGAELGLAEGVGGGVLEGLDTEAGPGEDALHAVEVERLTAVARADESEQVGSEPEPVAHHGDGLERLERGPGIYRGVDAAVLERNGSSAVQGDQAGTVHRLDEVSAGVVREDRRLGERRA